MSVALFRELGNKWSLQQLFKSTEGPANEAVAEANRLLGTAGANVAAGKLVLADGHARLGDAGAASGAAYEALDLFKGKGDKLGQAAALVVIAGLGQEALQKAQEAARLFKEEACPPGEVAALVALSAAHLEARRFEEALVAATNAQRIAEAKGGIGAGAALMAAARARFEQSNESHAQLRISRELLDQAIRNAQQAMTAVDGEKAAEAAAQCLVSQLMLAKSEGRQAREAARAAMDAAAKASDTAKQAEAMLAAANVELTLGEDLGTALHCALKAAEITKGLGDGPGYAAACAMLASVHGAREERKEPGAPGKSRAEWLLHFAKEHKDQAMEAQALRMAAQEYQAVAPDRALQTAKQSQDLFQQISNKEGEVQALETQVNLALAEGKTKDALAAATQACELFASLGKKSGEATASLMLCNAQLANRSPPAAVKAAQKAVGLFQELGDKPGAASAQLALANALLKQVDAEPGAAASAAENALNTFELVGSLAGAAAAKQFTAQALISEKKDYDRAQTLAQDAADHYQATVDDVSEIHALTTLAQARYLSGSYDAALVDAKRASTLAKQTGDKYAAAAASYTLANAHFAAGEVDSATQAAFEAVGHYRDLKDKSGLDAAERLQKQVQDYKMKDMAVVRKWAAPRVLMNLDIGDEAATNGLWSDSVIFSSMTGEGPYVKFCIELLCLVNALQTRSNPARLVIVTRGTLSRMCGGCAPPNQPAMLSNGIAAVVRSLRLEQPRMHIFTMDMAPHLTGNDIARCLPLGDVDSAWYPAPAKAN